MSAEDVAVDASVEVALDDCSEADAGVASVGLALLEPSVGVASPAIGASCSEPSAGTAPSAGADPSVGGVPSVGLESSPEPSVVVCLARTNEGSRAKTTLRLFTFTLVTGIDIAN